MGEIEKTATDIRENLVRYENCCKICFSFVNKIFFITDNNGSELSN